MTPWRPADHMKVALEKLDRQAELCLWEDRPDVCRQSQAVIGEFDKNLRFQQGNVTVPGEQELTDRLTESWKGYRRDLENFYQLSDLAPTPGILSPDDFCPDPKRSGRRPKKSSS